MRRISWMLAMILCVTVVLAGCGGKKDAASVVKDLNNVVDTLQSKDGSYKGTGKMTLYTGKSRRNTRWRYGTRIQTTTASA